MVIFQKICFVNEFLGWVIGENWNIGPTLMHTTDGGENWYLQHSFSGMIGESVCFINEMTGWVVGTEGIIYHTSDGGSNWNQQNSGVTNQLLDVFFIDELNGWVVGWDVILKTTDGGINWINVTPSGFIFNYLATVQFVDNSIGWTVGDNGTILKSTDAGNTWFSQGGPAYPHFRTMYFTDEMHGWIGGPIYYTSDGGENWMRQLYSSFGETRSLFMLTIVPDGLRVDMQVPVIHIGALYLKTTSGGVTFIEEEEINEIPTGYYLSNNVPQPI